MRNFRALCLLAGLVTLFTPVAEATHFRGTILTWRNEPAAGPNGVAFKIRFSARRDGYSGSAPDGYPAIGDVVREDIGGTSFDFGDGSAPTGTLNMRVVAIDPIDNTLTSFLELPASTTPGEIYHSYSGAGPFTAFYDTCCRISNDNLNPDGSYRAETLVYPGASNKCPTSNALSNVDAFQGRRLSFRLAAFDPEGRPLTFRYALTAESQLQITPIPGVQLNASTGDVVWDVPGSQTLGPYSTQIIVTDGVNKVPIDFTITVRDPALGFPPSFNTPPSPCNAFIGGKVGSELSFTIQATDPDAGQTVTLNNNGLPDGAVMEDIENPGNPAIQVFRWVPTADYDQTIQIVVLTANDGMFYGAPCSVTLPIGFSDLKVTKTHTGNFTAGSNGTFSILVENIGFGETKGPITLKDVLGHGLTYVSASGAGWSCSASGQVVTCTRAAAIAEGAFSTLTVTVAVDGSAVPATGNTATVEVGNDLNSDNNKAYDVVQVGGIDLAMAKIKLSNFYQGNNAAFTLTATNVGTAPTHTSKPIALASFANSRFGTDFTLDGSQMANTRAKLLNGANFGPGGRIGRAIVITDVPASQKLSLEYLSAFEVFFVGYLNDNSANTYTPDELAALQSFVENGGTLIADCEDFNFDNACNQFGYYAAVQAGAPMSPAGSASSHPIFKGPFGTVTTITGSQTQGYIWDASGATTLGVDGAGKTTLAEKKVGAGRLIMMGDIDWIARAASAGGAITTANDVFLGNLLAYAGNTGSIVLTDNLPSGLTFVSASGPGWLCNAVSGSLTCTNPGPVNVGASTSIQLVVAVASNASGSASNTSTVKTPNDGNPANDSSTLSFSYASASSALKGDIDRNGVVDVFDLVGVQNLIVGNVSQGAPPYLAPLLAADLNADGKVDILDVVALAGCIVAGGSC